MSEESDSKEKASLFARFLRAYRKASGGSLLFSIGIHAAILLIGAYFVVSQIVEDRKISFGGGEPGPKSEVQHKVKRRTTAAPAPNKRITTTSSIATVALPSMPNIPMNMGPTIAGAAGGGGFGSVGGLGGNGGAGGGGGKGNGFSKITFFGLHDTGTGGTLEGTIYDLKQTKGRRPTGMNPSNYGKVVADFIRKDWDESVLLAYYKGPKHLYASQICVPNIRAELGPKEFGVEKEIQPRMWVAHYKGIVTPPSSGTYHFVGAADDLVFVKFDGKTVRDDSIFLRGGEFKDLPGQQMVGSYVYSKEGSKRGWGLSKGEPMRVEGGKSYPIEILIGEQPGGVCHFILLIEREGASYHKDPATKAPILPVFRFDDVPHPEGDLPPIQEGGPIWKAGKITPRSALDVFKSGH